MKKSYFLIIAATVLFATANIWAATLYVGTQGTAGGNYYTEIQAAINAAADGDLILVSNGVYNTGGTINIDFHGTKFPLNFNLS